MPHALHSQVLASIGKQVQLPKLKVISSASSFVTSKDFQKISFPKPFSVCRQDYSDSDSICVSPLKASPRKRKRKHVRCRASTGGDDLTNQNSPREKQKATEPVKPPKINPPLRHMKAKSVKSTRPLTFHPDLDCYYVENEYTRFTITEKSLRTRVPQNRQGISIIRSQRLFHLTKQLRKCHQEYNKFLDLEGRDQFLTNEILQRYVMALDLALNESYTGVALEILHRVYDAAKCMIPLYTNIFYRLDGTHTPLPIVVNRRNDFIRSLAPVIYALNRIPFSSSSPDKNGHLRLETHLMKLQLEVLTLVVAPVESAIFRATLEVVPNTAFTAYQRLVLNLPSMLCWQNDSVMRKDYEGLLEKFGLADQLGCKGSLATINSGNAAKSSRRVNCDSELEMSDGDMSDL